MKFHYVYRITNIKENLHYYGTRSCKNTPKKDLGKKYFSSSSDTAFIQDQLENPHNFKYKILYIFSSRKDAITYEIKLHEKFNVGVNKNFYNRAKQTSTGWDTTGMKFPGQVSKNKGKPMSEEQKIKISNSLKGKKRPAEVCKKLSEARKGKIPWNKGKTMAKEQREACAKRIKENPPMLGKQHNNNTKLKMSESAKNLPILECPHCGKKAKGNSMKRWHFDNCKHKEQKNETTSF